MVVAVAAFLWSRLHLTDKAYGTGTEWETKAIVTVLFLLYTSAERLEKLFEKMKQSVNQRSIQHWLDVGGLHRQAEGYTRYRGGLQPRLSRLASSTSAMLLFQAERRRKKLLFASLDEMRRLGSQLAE